MAPPWEGWAHLIAPGLDPSQHREIAQELDALGTAWSAGPAALWALAATAPGLLMPGARTPAEAMAAAMWRRCADRERRPSERAAAVGRCVGHLVDLHAITLGPDPALTAPMARWLAASPVALTSAGRVDAPLRVLELRAGLGARAGQAALLETWAALRSDVPEGPFAQALDEGHAFLLSALRFTALAALARPRSAWSGGVEGPVQDALEKGRAHLRGAGAFPGSWEHQRWGLADDPRPLLGRLYIQLTILRSLRDCGDPTAAARLAGLIAAQPVAPLRYYEDWEHLPPDADSLGLVLLTDAETDAATPAQRQAWRAPLAPSLRADGTAPTWLVAGPDGPTTPEPRWTWGGDDCTASRTMLLRGLLAQGRPDDLPVVVHNLRGILAGHARGEHGSFYYELPWAWVLLQRLHQQPGARRLPADVQEALAQTLHGARRQVARAQRPDGGWGSPLATAMNLEILSGGGPGGLAVERGLRYLCDTQGPDGSWASEPFFLTIGKPPFPEHPHGGPELTTALCLAAAARALRSLRGDDHGHD